MKTVPLGGKIAAGRVALIDDEDAELIAGYSWFALSGHRDVLYAGAYIPGSGHYGRQIRMHHLLAGVGVDHINGNGLDNRRVNLRPATPTQNSANTRSRLGSTSRFKGVCWDIRTKRWRALITVRGKLRHLGRFDSEEDAARAYDAAALETWGEFARLNFPKEAPL